MSDTPLYPVKLLAPYGNLNAAEVAGFPYDEAISLCQRGLATLAPGLDYAEAFVTAATPPEPPPPPEPPAADPPAQTQPFDPEADRRQAEEAERLAAESKADAAAPPPRRR